MFIVSVLFVVLFALISTLPLAILRGFVLSKLWLWFVVPYFGLPIISIPLAIGLSILVALLTQSSQSSKKKEKAEIFDDIGNSMLINLMALLIGYIVTFFL